MPSGCAIVLLNGAVFACGRRGGKNLVEWAAVMSTGRAQEMQKGSSQFSVLSSQFSVLSSQ
ncbi:MAG TPA: hypothetical protein VFL34_08725, partial [Candidatus Sulfotelmatobacter sp.]|nr:hypothetical protein [Candidatus Sulfotelmatobacter sp.]